MERIWAPWRMKYILDVDKRPGCIFCEKWKEGRDEENLILHRGERCFVILNLFPYNSGHLMVVPAQHTSEIGDLSGEEKLELLDLTQKAIDAMRATMEPDGFNLGINLGRVAGAGIHEHLHLHVVPRWSGDTNFMPVVSDTKVISEGLRETYRKLKKGFKSTAK